jgi:hypothetical protein
MKTAGARDMVVLLTAAAIIALSRFDGANILAVLRAGGDLVAGQVSYDRFELDHPRRKSAGEGSS